MTKTRVKLCKKESFTSEFLTNLGTLMNKIPTDEDFNELNIHYETRNQQPKTS